jgi:isoleucyl-tRNA synthetase
MFTILKAMTRILAPILTFTAEEVWSALPAWKGKEASIHLTQFPKVNNQYLNADLGERWKAMIDAKAEISRLLSRRVKKK